jgi:hypothetical protein
VSGALLIYLQGKFRDPEAILTLIEDFKSNVREAMKAGGDPVRDLDTQIARQRRTVEAVTTALVAAPTSPALAQRLQSEEAKLADLERKRGEAEQLLPRPIPHDAHAKIASFVSAMTDEMQTGDLPVVGALLRSILAPFRMVAKGAGRYKLVGAIDLGRAADSATEVVAGARYASHHRPPIWLPIEATIP